MCRYPSFFNSRWVLCVLSFLFLCNVPLARANDTYDGTYLTIPSVTVGGITYTNVVITVANVISVGGTIPTPSTVLIADFYDPGLNLLAIRSVTFGGVTYTNVVIVVGNVIGFGTSYPSPNTPTLIPVNPLPTATVGQAYSQNVVFYVAPASRYTYMIDTLANGVTPSGMTVDMNGILSGAPFATGRTDVNGNQIPNTYTFGVCAVDTLSHISTTPCPQTSITVNPTSVTVTKAGTGSGTVAHAPAGNSCGVNCYSGFASGSTVTLAATPAAGSTFTGWSGACSGTGSCTLSANGNMAVTATFTSHPTCANGAVDYPTCTPPLSSVSPTVTQLGMAGSCSGGTLTTSFQITAASNVSWTVAGDIPSVGGGSTVVASPRSGTGPGIISVTITVPPQMPSSSYSNCSLTYNLGTFDNVYVTFSDGSVVGVTVYWTFVGVT